jgi:glycosyltransferase involved in cell wall biosynthesis
LNLETSAQRDGTLEPFEPGRRPIEPEFPTHELLNWHVEYAGPDFNGHLNEVQKRIKDLDVEGDFTYLGDLSDEEKWHAYRRADLFVLPTYSENFGIVVAEALAAGVPVITTKETPWQELLGSSKSSKVLKCGSSKVQESVTANETNGENGGPSAVGSGQSGNRCNDNFRTLELSNFRTSRCGWWIDIGAEPLAEALREAMGLSDEERCAMGENGRRLVETKYTWPAIAEQMKAAYEWIANGREPPESVSIG